MPPFGYAVLMARSRAGTRIPTAALARALAPYVVAQAVVLALVIAFPRMLWRDQPPEGPPPVVTPQSDEAARALFEKQLQENERK